MVLLILYNILEILKKVCIKVPEIYNNMEYSSISMSIFFFCCESVLELSEASRKTQVDIWTKAYLSNYIISTFIKA